MRSDRRFATSIVITVIATLVTGVATLSATLGAPAGTIVLGEVSGLACVTGFTLLIGARSRTAGSPRRPMTSHDEPTRPGQAAFATG